VVREIVSRWLAHQDFTLLHFDLGDGFPKALRSDEVTRVRRWKEHLHTSGSSVLHRRPAADSDAVVVPWRSRFLLPELGAEPQRCDAYRALARSGVVDGVGLIGYDLIPVTATETVDLHMSANFVNYLSVVKHATQLSAISESTGRDFEAFGEMLASQGLAGPRVAAHPLPSAPPPMVDADLERVRQTLQLGSLPLVLVVGSHEPRKNHVAVLEVAEAIWAAGGYFHILMIGGSGWASGEFDDYLHVLRGRGRPVTVWKRASEEELAAAYHLARFSLFPSLVEGYGLPIAESLAAGTPVITSQYGSMAEAAPRGALLVDPRDVGAIETAIRSLLDDDDLLNRLRKEAQGIDVGSWDQHADLVWKHLNS
jgi:glycosyltransferase involved in cell wall biosynthesis